MRYRKQDRSNHGDQVAGTAPAKAGWIGQAEVDLEDEGDGEGGDCQETQ